MKLNKILVMGALIGGSALGFSNHAQATDATGTATAQIRAAITLTEDTGMDFGIIVADPTGDTVSIDTAGAVTSTGASTFSGTSSAGGFTATGDTLSAVTISFSTGDVLTGPGADMALSGLDHDAGAAPSFDAAGDLDFDVSATLAVGASQTAGTYNGTYTATVDYQ